MNNFQSAIRDNHSRGPVHEFVTDRALPDSKLSVVSAYFTTFAYDGLKAALDSVGGMRFLSENRVSCVRRTVQGWFRPHFPSTKTACALPSRSGGGPLRIAVRNGSRDLSKFVLLSVPACFTER